MKVYLDDERKTPAGWVRTYTVAETILLLNTGKVTHLSLDHDLGDADPNHNGHDVMLWLEKAIRLDHRYDLMKDLTITFHTANPVGKAKMIACLTNIRNHLNGL